MCAWVSSAQESVCVQVSMDKHMCSCAQVSVCVHKERLDRRNLDCVQGTVVAWVFAEMAQ